MIVHNPPTKNQYKVWKVKKGKWSRLGKHHNRPLINTQWTLEFYPLFWKHILATQFRNEIHFIDWNFHWHMDECSVVFKLFTGIFMHRDSFSSDVLWKEYYYTQICFQLTFHVNVIATEVGENRFFQIFFGFPSFFSHFSHVHSMFMDFLCSIALFVTKNTFLPLLDQEKCFSTIKKHVYCAAILATAAGHKCVIITSLFTIQID